MNAEGSTSPSPRRRPQRHLRRRRRLLRVIFLLLGISAILPIATYFFAADVYRWYMIQSLDSADEDRRNTAFTYFLRHAHNDPGLVDAAVRNLTQADRAQFDRLRELLEQAGFWNRRHVPRAAWRRWLDPLAESGDPQERLFAAIRFADLPEDADDPALHELGALLIEDPEQAVRFEMLLTAARMSRQAQQPLPWVVLVGQATADDEPYIARDAIILFALIDSPDTGRALSWRAVAFPVAKATLWAAATTAPDQPRPLLDALFDPESPPALRAAAAWCAGLSGHRDARDVLVGIIDDYAGFDSQNETPSAPGGDLHIAWAAARFVPMDLDDPDDPARRALWAMARRLHRQGLEQPLNLWPTLAAVHRLAPLLHEKAVVENDDDGQWAALLRQPLVQLAFLEGLAPASTDRPPPAGAQAYSALAAAAAMRQLDAEALRPGLRSSVAPYRDLASLLAARRLEPDEALQLSQELLASLNDHNKLSGAVLAGLADLRPVLRVEDREHDALQWRIETARARHQWPLRQIYEMALWMQGRQPQWPEGLGRLLDNEQVPRSTLYLGLLEADPQRALRYLFEPRRGRGSGAAYVDQVMSTPVFPLGTVDALAPTQRRQEPVTLLDLLVRYRWMRVLEHYLPDEAPRLTLWADRWVQQFELDVLRYWLWLEGFGGQADAGEGWGPTAPP